MNTKRTSLYLPTEVEQSMKQLAVEHNRSLNGEIVQACKAWILQERSKSMKKPIIINPQTPEEEIEDFKALIPSLVKEGYITRNPNAPGEFGVTSDAVKPHLRTIAEEELKRQGK